MRQENTIFSLLRQINPWWENPRFRFDVMKREPYTEQALNKKDRLIHVLTGARRVGKTSIIHSCVNALLETVDPHRILYISCDTREARTYGIRTIIETYYKKYAQMLKKP